MLQVLGAEVEPVRPVSIVDPSHYVNLARRRALEFGKRTVVSQRSGDTPTDTPRVSTPAMIAAGGKNAPDLLVTSNTPAPSRPATPTTEKPPPDLDGVSGRLGYRDPPRGLFADQFENMSNLVAHQEGTAVEIWKQTAGRVDGFVSGAGTGGTIAGVGRYLKEKTAGRCDIVLSDPQGSGLYHKVGLRYRLPNLHRRVYARIVRYTTVSCTPRRRRKASGGGTRSIL